MSKIDKPYVFEGPDGKASLLDPFEGRRQLILCHFMFAPSVEGWPNAGCSGCSFFVDQIANLTHLHARDWRNSRGCRSGSEPDDEGGRRDQVMNGLVRCLQREIARTGVDIAHFSSECQPA